MIECSFFCRCCFFTETPRTVSGLLTLHPDLSSLFWERQRRDFPLQDGHQEAAAFLPRPTILLPIKKPTLALSKILFTVLLSEEKKERREEGKKEEKSCLSQFLDHQVHLRLSVRSADLEGHATQGKGRDQNKIGFLLRMLSTTGSDLRERGYSYDSYYTHARKKGVRRQYTKNKTKACNNFSGCKCSSLHNGDHKRP